MSDDDINNLTINLLYNKNDVRIYDKIQTQEKNLLKNSYPKI